MEMLSKERGWDTVYPQKGINNQGSGTVVGFTILITFN